MHGKSLLPVSLPVKQGECGGVGREHTSHQGCSCQRGLQARIIFLPIVTEMGQNPCRFYRGATVDSEGFDRQAWHGYS